MTIGALAIADEEPELAAKIIADGRNSIPRAMASFAPDGGWAEGPGYWGYATEYNVFSHLSASGSSCPICLTRSKSSAVSISRGRFE